MAPFRGTKDHKVGYALRCSYLVIDRLPARHALGFSVRPHRNPPQVHPSHPNMATSVFRKSKMVTIIMPNSRLHGGFTLGLGQSGGLIGWQTDSKRHFQSSEADMAGSFFSIQIFLPQE